MEKENSKERENAKKKYTQSIRQLVEFLKKRDPRIKEGLKKEEEKKKEREEQEKKRKELREIERAKQFEQNKQQITEVYHCIDEVRCCRLILMRMHIYWIMMKRTTLKDPMAPIIPTSALSVIESLTRENSNKIMSV